MENNNIPNKNKEGLSTLELLENIVFLSCAEQEQETNKVKDCLKRCPDPDAECTGCPYEGKSDGLLRCFDKLMQDALKLIVALEKLCTMQAETIASLCGKAPEDEENDENT